jgi:ubiquinone/menaquinone biosynthesis C-methylase UbiE
VDVVVGRDAAEHDSEQSRVTRRYDRMAWLYDIYDAPMEWMGTRRRRARLLAWASGRVLEVGVGTGRNLEHYPNTVTLSAIDVSPLMLARARRRAGSLDRAVAFEVADVAALPYRDDTFDTTVATCVFCSVADPVEGLRELGRVTKAEGRILLLEHVRPRNRLLGWLADLATTVTRACLASVQTGAPRRTSPRPT